VIASDTLRATGATSCARRPTVSARMQSIRQQSHKLTRRDLGVSNIAQSRSVTTLTAASLTLERSVMLRVAADANLDLLRQNEHVHSTSARTDVQGHKRCSSNSGRFGTLDTLRCHPESSGDIGDAGWIDTCKNPLQENKIQCQVSGTSLTQRASVIPRTSTSRIAKQRTCS